MSGKKEKEITRFQKIKKRLGGKSKHHNDEDDEFLDLKQQLQHIVTTATTRLMTLEECNNFMEKTIIPNSSKIRKQFKSYEWFFSNLVCCGEMGAAAANILKISFDCNVLNVEIVNRENYILTACRYRTYEVVEFLVKAGADPTIIHRDRTALFYLARGEHDPRLTECLFLEKFVSMLPKDQMLLYINAQIEAAPNLKTTLDFTSCAKCSAYLRSVGAKTGDIITRELMDTKLGNLSRANLAQLGKTIKERNFQPKFPVIIVPGTCSSKLEVYTSPTWERGTLLWTDPTKMGTSALNKLSRVIKQKDNVQFVKHMKLEDDGISDPPGIIVRPVEGLQGCDYLCPTNAFTRAEFNSFKSIRDQSVVLGNLIRTFIDAGYTPANLKAFTYDWRLSPTNLQKRDSVMLKLKYEVEFSRISNNEKVMLLGHSQGGKFIQYFLNWVADEKNGGTKWIDENIEGVLALGIPWVGAPKAIRGVIAGDNMGLPTQLFLGDGYMLAMCRSYSSVPWLFPHKVYTDCVNRNATTEDWQSALERMGADKSLRFYRQYLEDPYIGREIDGEMINFLPPYVSKIYNIYGVGGDTEIGAYYKPNSKPEVIGGECANYVIDTSINIDNKDDAIYVDHGIIYERMTDTKKSGDKTVPYESLAYPNRWKNMNPNQTIKTYEFKLSGTAVDHRSMVSEPVMLELVVELACGATIPEKFVDSYRRSIFDYSWEELATQVDKFGIPIFLGHCIHFLIDYCDHYDPASTNEGATLFRLFNGVRRLESEVSDIGHSFLPDLPWEWLKRYRPSSVAWCVVKFFREKSEPYFTSSNLSQLAFLKYTSPPFLEEDILTGVQKAFKDMILPKKAAGLRLLEFLHFLSRTPNKGNTLEVLTSQFTDNLTDIYDDVIEQRSQLYSMSNISSNSNSNSINNNNNSNNNNSEPISSDEELEEVEDSEEEEDENNLPRLPFNIDLRSSTTHYLTRDDISFAIQILIDAFPVYHKLYSDII